MNLQTYLMIKQANEAIDNSAAEGLSTTKPKYAPGAGLQNVLGRSSYMRGLLAPRGVVMGTGPDGKTTYMEGPPIVNNNGIQKIIKSTLGTLGAGGPVRYQ